MTEGKRTKSDGSLHKYPHIKCFKCGEYEYYKSDCLKNIGDKEEGTTQTVTETVLTTYN